MLILVGLLIFLLAPFVVLSIFGINRPLNIVLALLFIALLLSLGAILGFGLSFLFMDPSYFKEMPIEFMTNAYVDTITGRTLWKGFIIPYLFMIDCIWLYFKISFLYKPNIILWACEIFTWVLSIIFIKQVSR